MIMATDSKAGDWYETERKKILERTFSALELNQGLSINRIVRRGFYKSPSFTTVADLASCATGDDKVYLWKVRSDKRISPDGCERLTKGQGDITTLEVDAIVNAANEGLLGGGGIDEAIHGAAGPLLQRECALFGRLCPAGQTVITRGYRLPADYVLHTVGPYLDQEGRTQPRVLESCYQTVLEHVHSHRLRSIGLCSISTGFYGYPKREAADIAVQTVRKWLAEARNRAAVDAIIFVAFTDEDFAAYQSTLQAVGPQDA